MERAEEMAKTLASWRRSGSKLYDVSGALAQVAGG